MTVWLAGVDGCKAGWIVAFVEPDGSKVTISLFNRFKDIIAAPEQPAIVAIDVPIGLPARIGPNGRGPEREVRRLVGARRSSVFPVPSRCAVYARDYPDACRLASETSCPPRKVSRQFFGIAKKIQEVDIELRAEPPLTARVYEVHPEVAFWRLNSDCELKQPKKTKAGLGFRRSLLARCGFAEETVDLRPPPGAAIDDLLDALACAAIARRILAGVAVPFPNPPLRDDFGLPVAIWA